MVFDLTTFDAADSKDIAVDLLDIIRTCPLVETVNILGYDEEGREDTFHLSQGDMTGVGSGLKDNLLTPVVPLPYQLGIPLERLGCSQFKRIVVLP